MADESQHIRLIVVADTEKQVATLELVGDDGHMATRVVDLHGLDEIIMTLIKARRLFLKHHKEPG
jgi:hypothetical protein